MKKIIILVLCLLLTGCYNYKELNKIAIVSSISIDKKENIYLVGAQVLNVKPKDDSNSSNVIVYEEEGKTIEEALRNITKKSNKKLYGGHLSKLVISEEVAKEGIIDIVDLFQRLPEIKDEFTITISKGIDANKVIKVMTSPESIPADFVKNVIDSADVDSALTHSSKLDEFVSYYLKKYIDPVITVLEVKDYDKNGTTLKNNESTYPKTKIVLDYIGITYKGKLESYLNKDETIGYNFIRDNIDQMVIPIKCDKDNYASISILNSKTKVKVDKNYNITFNIENKSALNEYNCINSINKNKLEQDTNKIIKKYINKALEKQDKSKSQFLGLKRYIYLKYPKYNNEEYKVKINVKTNITRTGEINKSSKGEKNEDK